MIRIALLEDDQNYFNQFKDYVEKYKNEGHEVFFKWFSDGYDFLESYKLNEYDVIFMDIEMPAIDGISVAKKLRTMDTTIPIVFVTVMAQLAIKGYEVDAMDFIVKPITYFNFVLKLEKAAKITANNNTLVLKLLDDSGNKIFITSVETYYIESIGHKCIFHTTRGVFYRFASMRELSNQLECVNFLRCNNSYLVNPSYIKQVGADSITINNDQIPISRAKKKEFMEKLTKYYDYVY